jgi:hypothetical protein
MTPKCWRQPDAAYGKVRVWATVRVLVRGRLKWLAPLLRLRRASAETGAKTGAGGEPGAGAPTAMGAPAAIGAPAATGAPTIAGRGPAIGAGHEAWPASL